MALEEMQKKRRMAWIFKMLAGFCLFIALWLCGQTEPVQAEVVNETRWSSSRLITEDVTVRGTITIPEGCDVTVWGYGGNYSFTNATVAGSDGKRYPMFQVEEGATLTLVNVKLNGAGVRSKNSACVVVRGKDVYGNPGTLNIEDNVYIYGSYMDGSEGGHGVYGDSGSTINMKNGVIWNCEGYGIGSYGEVNMSGGAIVNCRIGIDGNGSGTNITMSGGAVHNNYNGGLHTTNGSIRVTGGNIYENPIGVASENGNISLEAQANVHHNSGSGVVSDGGAVYFKSGEVHDNSDQGFYLSNCNTWFIGGSVYNNKNGFSVSGGNFYGNRVDIRNNSENGITARNVGDFKIYDGSVHDNVNGVILNNCTSAICGGEIRNNSGTGIDISGGTAAVSGGSVHDNTTNIQNGGTLEVKGGADIHHARNNGIVNKGALTVSGGNIRDNAHNGVWNAGNGTVHWSGGGARGNEYDVWHTGKEWDSGLVVDGGANGGSSMKIYLGSRNRYVRTDSTHPFQIVIPSDCYVRGKWLIHTSSGGQAGGAYNNLSFADSGAFTKRAYGNDVVVWDHYTQTTKNYKYEGGRWNYFGTDKNEEAWGGETYNVGYPATPANYRNYAIVRTDPARAGWIADTDGQGYACRDISSANTFYACYYPKNYNVHFEGNGATGGSTPDQVIQYGVSTRLNSNGFVRGFTVGYNVNGGSSVERGSDTVNSDFTGWKIDPAAVNISYTDGQAVTNIAEPGQTRNLYAAWHDNAVTLPNASKNDEYWEVSADNKGWVRYYFTGWYTAPDGGQCVGRGGDAYIPKQNVTLYAHWTYNVFVYYDGNTNDGGGMAMTDPAKGDEKTRGVDYIIRENSYTKTGYDFAGWNTAQVDGSGNIVETGLPRFTPGSVYNEDIPVTLFAAWQHRFDIAYMGVCQTEGNDYLDNNGGADYSQLTDTVKLAKSDDLKIQTERSFHDAESGDEVTEDVTGTGVGWAFSKNIEAKYREAYIADDTTYPARDFFLLARDNGAVTYGSVSPDYQSQAPALNSPDMAVVNMYRVWDYGPVIEAYDLYYTLAQAQSGYITEDELLSHAKVTDEEDGEITGGDHADKGNSFRVMDYSTADFTGFTADGSVTETYLATDSAGNQTRHKVTVHVTDSAPQKVMPAGTTRFISEKYDALPSDKGGLKENSVWKTDPDYRNVLEQTFENQKNKTPEKTYQFDHDTVLEMQKFWNTGVTGNFMDAGKLLQFYDRFLQPAES